MIKSLEILERSDRKTLIEIFFMKNCNDVKIEFLNS